MTASEPRPTRRPAERERRRRGSVMVLFTMVLPLLVVPMAGLAIDGTIMRIVQAKLSAAVDGAALAAGRLLGTTANSQEIATEFLNANFSASSASTWWSSYVSAPTVTVTVGTTKTIGISAAVNVPLIFGRVFRHSTGTVSASGTATRRDSRTILVIDRSGSMNTSDGAGSTVIADLKTYASGFTQKFAEGVDEVGLIVYDGSAVVGYPITRPWDSTITATSTGGPDKSFNDGTSNDMVHQIAAISAGGYTGMAEGLWLAYIELQKAHLKDLHTYGVDDRLNAIVLFTDGVPTATSVYLNNNAVDNCIISTSKCTYKTNSTQKMIGWVGITGPPFSSGSINGLYGMASSDTTKTANWWMLNANSDTNAPVPTTPESACTGITGTNFYTSSKTDLSKIPSYDAWGNSMAGTAYSNSYFVNSSGHTTSPFTGTLNTTQKVSASNWALATWNGVDATANNIRNDSNLANRSGDSQNMQIAIYVIGYLGNGGVDQGLLLRVANDKSSSSYSQSQATGVYVSATDVNALANAFNVIAASILRLSQ